LEEGRIVVPVVDDPAKAGDQKGQDGDPDSLELSVVMVGVFMVYIQSKQ
jgi:hypothetical protein